MQPADVSQSNLNAAKFIKQILLTFVDLIFFSFAAVLSFVIAGLGILLGKPLFIFFQMSSTRDFASATKRKNSGCVLKKHLLI
jgi:hypothetical protein